MDELKTEDLAAVLGGDLRDANGNPIEPGPGPTAGEILQGIQDGIGDAINGYFDAAEDFINWVDTAGGGGQYGA